MIRDKIKETIVQHNLINGGEHIVIGLSGGPDSVCLFHVLRGLRAEMGFFLYAVHVNHRFRPGAAEEDQAYVEALCAKEKIPCSTYTYDCPALAEELGLTGEEAGRKVRYEAFAAAGQRLIRNGIAPGKIKIAVAQNADDQAETVLLRLLRGTGPDGLAGMAYMRRAEELKVIRPLLDVRRSEIERYCREHDLAPRIDQTNLQPIYTRNKVRLQLLPYLKEHFNDNIEDALLRLSKIAGEDKEYLWNITEQTYKDLMISSGHLDLKGLKSLEHSIRHRVILKAFEEVGLRQDITARHLEAADHLIAHSGTSKTLDFPAGYAMTIGYETVHFHRRNEASNDPCSRKLSMQVTEPCRNYPQGAAVFDWEEICRVHGLSPKVELRTRRAGDYIGLKSGRKKLQDFFVDRKIPREERDHVPIAAVDSEVLWVIADGQGLMKKHRYNEKYKLDPETKKVLVLEFICGI